MIRKKYDASRDTSSYYTSSKQYLASRNLTFQQNQYNYIRMGDASAKPGSNLASNNLYSPNGLNHCKKYFVGEGVSFGYKWIDGNDFTVEITSGYYYVNEINDLFKKVMIENNHYYTKNQVGLNADPYHDVLTFLLNISFSVDSSCTIASPLSVLIIFDEISSSNTSAYILSLTATTLSFINPSKNESSTSLSETPATIVESIDE